MQTTNNYPLATIKNHFPGSVNTDWLFTIA
jgi:hypothetical protein